MAEEAKVMALHAARDFEGRVGDFRVEVRGGADGGELILTPTAGSPLRMVIQGDRLEMTWDGPSVSLSAPDAEMELAAKNITLTAEDTVAIHGRKEVDVHSTVDVEIRADHQVNLWAHGVLVGD